MTNQRNLRITLLVTAVAITSFFVLSSWDFKKPFMLVSDYGQSSDTIPKKSGGDIKGKKIRDLDDVLDELNSTDLKIDMEKAKKEIEEAMKKIDKEKIRMEVDKALQEVDIQKIQRDIQASIAEIDWKKIQSGLDQEMKKIDFDKIQKDVNASISKIDMDKLKEEINREMKNLNVDMNKLEADLSKIGPEIEKSMEKAKADIEKAKTEMKEYNDFVDGLEKDGLLNRKEGYTIKHKNGELIINNKKASENVYNKYRSFLEKHKKFTINKSDDDFNIDID